MCVLLNKYKGRYKDSRVHLHAYSFWQTYRSFDCFWLRLYFRFRFGFNWFLFWFGFLFFLFPVLVVRKRIIIVGIVRISFVLLDFSICDICRLVCWWVSSFLLKGISRVTDGLCRLLGKWINNTVIFSYLIKTILWTYAYFWWNIRFSSWNKKAICKILMRK